MLGVGVVGAVATAFRAKSADAADSGACLRSCSGLRGANLIACVTGCSCESNGFQVCGSGKNRLCCSRATKCVGVNSTTVSVNGRPGICLPIPAPSNV